MFKCRPSIFPDWSYFLKVWKAFESRINTEWEQMKTEWAEIKDEWNHRVKPDTQMSDTSTNAVQNKVIKAYVDSHSGGGGTGVVDTAMSDTSPNAVQNRVIKRYADNIRTALENSIRQLVQHYQELTNTVNANTNKIASNKDLQDTVNAAVNDRVETLAGYIGDLSHAVEDVFFADDNTPFNLVNSAYQAGKKMFMIFDSTPNPFIGYDGMANAPTRFYFSTNTTTAGTIIVWSVDATNEWKSERKSVPGGGLPSGGENGDFLRIVDGVPTWAKVGNARGVDF